MRKSTAKELKEVAEMLPVVFQWEQGSTVMKGWELNLTPLADNQLFEKDKDYTVPVPQMRAVLHEQQIKDAYKTGGVKAAHEYATGVVKKVKSGEFAEAILR